MANITHNDITEVYSGRSGCMCGCNGTYRDSQRSKKNMLTRILKQDYGVDFFGRPDSDGVAGCIYVDNGERTQVAYFKVGTKIFEDVDQETLDEEINGEMVTRKNLMTGKEYQERYDTPAYMSPARESFWSM